MEIATTSDFQRILEDIWSRIPRDTSNVMLVSPEFYAVFETHEKFAGRDRRRIKREIRKAADKARKAQPVQPYGGIDKASNPFWRNRSEH